MPDRSSTSTAPTAAQTTGRATQMLLVAVIGMAFIGFVVGLRQGVPSHEAPRFEPAAAPTHHTDAVRAISYAEFDRRTHGPNSGWRSVLTDLAQPEADLFAPVRVDEDERSRVIVARADRRAFEGAPPVVPHPIDQMSAASCMACHAEGLVIGPVRAPRMSHEYLANCTQCHVEQWSVDFAQAPAIATRFVGLVSPGRGQRAWPGAPPTVPHPTFMRENCMACHGPTGPEPIRTSHPWQTNCLQCHAPSAAFDQGVVDDSPAFLPPIPLLRR